MLRLLVIVAALCLCQGVAAQVYLGGSVGVSDTFIEGDDDVLEYDGDVAYRVFVGNRLSQTFALEVAYVDYAEYDIMPLVDLPATITLLDQSLSVTGVDLAFVGNFPFNSRLSLFGRLGVFFWEAQLDSIIEEQQADGSLLRTVEAPTTEDIDVSAGVGFNYKLLNNLGMTLEANTHRSDQLWNMLYGAGLYFTF